ncbi:MAG TPA: aminotransferase class V-fold PLP-dependent enzyme [Gemmatimonadales bacterium]
MTLTRRQMLMSLTAGLGLGTSRCTAGNRFEAGTARQSKALRQPNGEVDWHAVRELFPLAPDWIHLASFFLVSHPKPVAEAIEHFRRKIDADPAWIEQAAFSESEGRPFAAIKSSLAGYIGGAPEEICFAPNTTGALALAYHGLQIRADQEILTTEHDHYSHHESIRYAAARSGCGVRYLALYDRPAHAAAAEIIGRLERAISPRTRAVGVTWVHSSTGVKLPITAMAEVVARANRGRASADRCLLIVDGVHGFANQDVDVARLGCDFFAAGTHKWLFAPRGTGFLWGRSELWPELRPTIPTFDPDAPQTWLAWMERQGLPPTRASFVSPGGFIAFEYAFAIPAAVELHRTIGRDRIAARIRELNGAFREAVAALPGITLHTPRDPELSGGITCFEVAGLKADEVAHRLAAKRIRTNSSPYRTSYPRVAAGIMNFPEDLDAAVREIRALVQPA